MRERFSAVFITDVRIERLKEAVEAGREPTFHAYRALHRHATANIGRVPRAPASWHVPGFYRDPVGHHRAKNGLRDDAGAAYAMALCFRITGEERFAQAALRLIDAWPATVREMSREADSTLSFSYHYPAMIFAADLLRDQGVWAPDGQQAFRRFLAEEALPMNTMDRQNNWGNWGLVLALACAVYLEDDVLFRQGADRWRSFIGSQIDGHGHLPHEVRREGGTRGIWYSHFTLMPQTIAAEILRVNGLDPYETEGPSGQTLKSAFAHLAAWTERPETFPFHEGDPRRMLGVRYFSYFEILNDRWPHGAATRLLRESRPLSAEHSAPFLTFTHGRPLPDDAGAAGWVPCPGESVQSRGTSGRVAQEGGRR